MNLISKIFSHLESCMRQNNALIHISNMGHRCMKVNKIIVIAELLLWTYVCDWCAFFLWYNELSKKNRFQSVPIAALCLYNIQRENLVLKKSLCMFLGKVIIKGFSHRVGKTILFYVVIKIDNFNYLSISDLNVLIILNNSKSGLKIIN